MVTRNVMYNTIRRGRNLLITDKRLWVPAASWQYRSHTLFRFEFMWQQSTAPSQPRLLINSRQNPGCNPMCFTNTKSTMINVLFINKMRISFTSFSYHPLLWGGEQIKAVFITKLAASCAWAYPEKVRYFTLQQIPKQSQWVLTYGAEPFLRSCQLCSYSRNSQHFMEPESSLPCSQDLSTGPYPDPDRSSQYYPILSL
jgi:hypothetical protein